MPVMGAVFSPTIFRSPGVCAAIKMPTRSGGDCQGPLSPTYLPTYVHDLVRSCQNMRFCNKGEGFRIDCRTNLKCMFCVASEVSLTNNRSSGSKESNVCQQLVEVKFTNDYERTASGRYIKGVWPSAVAPFGVSCTYSRFVVNAF